MASIGSLFSGIDGLALGVQLCTGARLAWHCERDTDASAILARHWRAPNLGDITAVDWSAVEPVDILVGGFPCQDISLAGKGAGIDGERSGLWTHFVRAIRALRPRVVFVENVSALATRGLDRVLGDLAESRYDAAWSTVSSASVGAPHRRERLFILAVAYADGAGLERSERIPQQSQPAEPRGVEVHAPEATTPDADGAGLSRVASSRARAGGPSRHDTDGRSASPRALPRRDSTMGDDTRPSRTAAGSRRLNPAFVEWMMGFPDGWTEGVKRTARLRLLGNAVQPQVAMAAWDGLIARVSP